MEVRQVQRRKPARPALLGVRATQIPLEQAYTYQNRTPPVRHRERGCDRIGSVKISSSLPVGTLLGKVMMNPLEMPSTRLYGIAKNFEMYRFRSARLTFMSSFTTATSGAIVMAYSINPELDLGGNANNQLFSLNGTSSNLFVRCESNLRIGDGNKWFKLDADSKELMDTTQGFFGIAVDQVASISAETSVSLFLEYDIEFRGPAQQQVNYGTPLQVTGGTLTGITGNQNTFTATFTPSPTAGTLYAIVPAYTVKNADDRVTAQYASNNSSGIFLFLTADDFNAFTPIPTVVGQTDVVGGSTWYPVVPN